MKKIIVSVLLVFVCVSFSNFTVDTSFAQDTFVVAQFYPVPGSKFNLVISRSGGGQGNVTATPAGVNCGSKGFELPTDPVCLTYNSGAKVALTATPAQYNSFSGWGGNCKGTATKCYLIITQNMNVTATFAPPPKFDLSVIKSGQGTGTVSSSPPGINCGSTCPSTSYAYYQGTTVTLTATPAQCSSFSGWGQSCSGIAPTCSLTMTGPKGVTATFTALTAAFSADRTVEPPTCPECYYCTAPNNQTSLICKPGVVQYFRPYEWDGMNCNFILDWCRRYRNDPTVSTVYDYYCR